MDFAFSEEQEQLRAAARDYLSDRFPLERVVALVDGEPGWDVGACKQLAELGWLDAELGFLDHAVLFEETGAALLPAPYFAGIGLGWPLLDESLRETVSSGERSVTVAWAEPDGPQTLRAAGQVRTVADAAGRLTGRKTLVPDLVRATDVVVVARGPQGPGLYAVETAAASVLPRSTMDRTRPLAELVLDATPARALAQGDAAVGAVRAARLRAMAALSLEAVGVAQRALDIAAEQAKTREQFGRVIGGYQAVSHRVADIYVTVELARSLAYWAAWCVAESDPQADQAAAAALSAAGEGATFACENAIQVMGGVGFTWEHPLHRYYKRALWVDAFEGPGRAQRAELAAALLDTAT